MPIGEIEAHPYLEQGQIEGAEKLILGSFPVYECTDSDNKRKIEKRQKEGTVRFFYGSKDSQFWKLYHENIDDDIYLPIEPEQVLNSLKRNKIAITDTIMTCQRHDLSSLDSKLIKRDYNVDGIQNLIKDGVRRILCTSKGVLNDLEKQIILSKEKPMSAEVDVLGSCEYQHEFISNLGGNNNQIVNHICRVFQIDDYEVIALAIPSPGSPQRKLDSFGFNGDNWKEYADNYFTKAFDWLDKS